MSETKLQPVTVVFADPTKPSIEYGVRVPKLGRMSELKIALEKLCGVPVKAQVIADIWVHKVYRFFEEEASVSEMRNNDKIYMFELPELLDSKAADYVLHQVLHRATQKTDHVGVPCVLALRRNSKASSAASTHFGRYLTVSPFQFG